MTIGPDGEIDVQEYLFQPHSIGILKRPVEQELGDLKSDELLVRGGSIAALGCLKNVESELCLGVGNRIVGISHQLAVLQPKLGIEHRNDLVDSQRVAVVVGGIVRQRSQCESVGEGTFAATSWPTPAAGASARAGWLAAKSALQSADVALSAPAAAPANRTPPRQPQPSKRVGFVMDPLVLRPVGNLARERGPR